jgi:hypothetical protein
VKKIFLYIAAGLVVFTLLFYLVFFLTLSGDTITGEINRVIEKAGYEVRAGSVSKGIPLRITLEDVTLTGPGGTDRVSFPRVVFLFKLSDFFGRTPIRFTIRDREDNSVTARLSRGLDSLMLSGSDFNFSPEKRRSLPSFFARKLDFDIGRIGVDESGGNISVAGVGTFQFDYLTVKGQYGVDVEITGLSGKVIFRDQSLYFKDCSATVLSSTFTFEGTVSDYLRRGKSTVDIEARGRNISPLLSNLLKLKPENEYNVKIRIRGNLNAPDIRVMSR